MTDGVSVYRALIVANGHHWSRRWPEPPFPGEFTGQTMHAHDYRTPEEFAGKNVLVVGFGNSAIDIAVELSRVARSSMLSVRRGFHVIPKFILGRPLDQSIVPERGFPFKLQRAILNFVLRLQQGDVTQYGLPRPDHALLHAHPTVSADLLTRLSHGDIKVQTEHPGSCPATKYSSLTIPASRLTSLFIAPDTKLIFPFSARPDLRSEQRSATLLPGVSSPIQ